MVEKITFNIYEKLQRARVLLQKKNLKKSGENKFAKFKYYELSDFIPAVNEIFAELRICSHFNLLENTAELTIFNSENIICVIGEKYSLGIYVSHLFIILFLGHFGNFGLNAWIVPFVVLIISLFSTWLYYFIISKIIKN